MQFLTGILIAIGWILLLPIVRMTTTFFHEMGHAIPALIFTNDKVEVFVGSYGDPSKSIHLKLGRLIFHLRFDILDWKIGMCISSGRAAIWQQLIITLGGPVASLLVCGTVLYYLNTGNYPFYVLTIALAMFLLAIFDLFVNLIPAATHYRGEDGKVLMSDGRQILNLLSLKDMPEDYFKLEEHFHNKDYNKVIDEIKSKAEAGKLHKKYYLLQIKALIKTSNHEGVIAAYEKMVDHHPLVLDDYRTIGLSYLEIKNYTECVRCLNEYLFTNFRDFEANCARGIARMNLDENEEALRDFNAAISYSNKNDISRALAHRGFVLIKMGMLDEAIHDLNLSKKHDSQNGIAELTYYFAVYHEKEGNFEKALEHFEKAKAENYDHYGLDYKIYEMEEKIKKTY